MEESEGESGKETAPGVREMVEALLGLGCVAGLNWWIPASWRHLLFCAFFLVVFAVAVRSQTIVAYSASLLAALSYGLLTWLHPEMRAQPNFPYLALEPFILLASGICASDILRWQRQRLYTFEQKCTQISATLRETQERYHGACMINESLERQVAGQPTTVATMSEKITRLWKQGNAERYPAIVDLISYAVEAQSCALYIQYDGLWHLYAEQPGASVAHTPVLNMDDPLLKRVIEQGEVSTIRDALAAERSSARNAAVMAGPLLNEVGEVVGIMIIDNLSLLKFTPGAIRIFRSLLHIASISLQTVEHAEREHQHLFAKHHLVSI